MPEMQMDEEEVARMRLILIAALTVIVIGGGIDIYLDQPVQWLSVHMIFETSMIAGAMLLALSLWLGWWRAARAVHDLEHRLNARQAERDAWRSSAQAALDGLGRAIDQQFDAWSLTPAEREVALLLLKGYSHKHIAVETGRSEKTARQHAGAVYQKAGVASRAELAAYFLGDLLLPEATRRLRNEQR